DNKDTTRKTLLSPLLLPHMCRDVIPLVLAYEDVWVEMRKESPSGLLVLRLLGIFYGPQLSDRDEQLSLYVEGEFLGLVQFQVIKAERELVRLAVIRNIV